MISQIKNSKIFSSINPQTILFFFHNFFINVGTTLVYVSANVLLLENHPEYSLPIAYVAAAIAVMAAGKVYEHFEHHLVLKRLSLGTMLSSLLMVVVVMGLLWAGHGIATAIAIMVGYRIIYLLINLEFWGLSALVFDVRQSKRLFSVIGSGDMPAKALGAVLAVLIHSPSVLMILLVISLVFFALAFYTQILTFRFTEIPNPHHARPRQISASDSKIIQKYFGGNKLLTSLCLGMVLVAAAATWIEYHFFVNVKYKFHSQHDVIGFVGTLLSVTYVIATFVKLIFSGKTVERFGVKLTLFLLPLTTIVISLGLLISSYFRKDEPSLLVYYCAAYLLFELVRRTIFDPVFLVLFQPLSTKTRLKGHTLAKGLFEPLGMLIAGGLLWIIYTQKLSNISLTFDLSLLFAVAALLIFRKAYGHYIQELKNAISKRFIRSGEMASPSEALPIITENLKSERKEEVLNAIDWLARNKESVFRKNVDLLLKNPITAVRLKTLQTLAGLEKPELSDTFLKYIETEPDTACQTLAVRIAASKSQLTDEQLARFLAHEDLDIVKGSILGSWEAGKALPLIHGTLRRLFLSEQEDAQLIALDCVKTTGLKAQEEFVKTCLRNGSEKVRNYALEVAATVGSPQLLRELKPLLTGSLSRQTVASLIKSGDSGISIVEEWLHNDLSQERIHTLIRVAEKTKHEYILQILFKLIKNIYHNINLISSESNVHFKNIDTYIHRAALKALTNYSLMADYKQIISEFVEKELFHASMLLSGMDENEADEAWNNTLDYELELTSQRLFYLFMMQYDKDAVQNAWKGIRHASREKRANSLEMIESLLPRVLYPSLHALFENIPIQKKREALRQYMGNQESGVSLIPYILTQKEKLFTEWTIALAIAKSNDQNDLALIANLHTHSSRLIRDAVRIKLATNADASILNLTTNPMKHAETSQQISEMERVIVLKNTQLFAQTPENVLSSIAPIMKEITYSDSQEIFAKGDPGDSMYIIYTGQIGIYDGKKQLALFDKGEIFGELALLDTEPRSATTVAETDTLVFRIDQEDFFELMEERDEILRNVLRILCQRIRAQNEKMRLL
ncbi:cyclic nucleotide-binding domain-containing protein [Dyadobacter fanqingshengii]|uniref:Cyclic nucleotide-binding domain-containing protein n=1 Tax=Dyadobacter fanqingshengii TaxID=2906443 RepID=A0A9X1PBT8_9BACT|nr:cyclic nucleotide-binding domain-containing protein [Dyadobacter fanqingshengii]MCF0041038.1 cyclic nucleotide-binding domain-containing protein [Dyadobacter fanqingshengii]USJ37233.1 cyclic nucleotide-binding domain-containing protein [Dyadobacter fanqingshengii]